MENVINGFFALLSLDNFIAMNVGLCAGIIMGALPGLTATMGVAVLLPLTYGMDPTAGILLLLGVYCGGTYGGSITAILIRTPGTPASAATVLDGHPLAQSGQGGRALDMAIKASTIGGIISAFMLLFLAPQIANFALKFGPAEKFTLALFGLTIIAAICSKDLLKGLSMAALGIFISCIGIDSIMGVPRFTFGNMYMEGGIELIPALIGLFAFSEIMNKVRDINIPIGEVGEVKGDKISGKELKECMPTIVKSSLIGTLIGAIPGTGAAIASFLSYQEAKRSSKHPEEYGHGSIEGISASEAGNNGVTGATLIPLLTLGVPGDSITAVLLGALTMQGLVPGPMLFSTHGTTMYAIIIGLLFVNVFMFLQAKVFIKPFSQVTKIPVNVLIPVLLVVSVTGVYATNNAIFDVWVAIVMGVVGYVLIQAEYPVTPLLLSLILGPMAEKNLRQAIQLSGTWTTFFTKPICIVFILLSVGSIVLSLMRSKTAKDLVE